MRAAASRPRGGRVRSGSGREGSPQDDLAWRRRSRRGMAQAEAGCARMPTGGAMPYAFISTSPHAPAEAAPPRSIVAIDALATLVAFLCLDRQRRDGTGV